MNERRNLITGEPLLFAPGRAGRPGAFVTSAPALPAETSDEACPFCPGQEHQTPPTIARTGDPWRVRVFANKFPPADGAEVIVETPAHRAAFDEIRHADEVLSVYVERYRAHASAAYVSLFKNEGRPAGASIPHVHSQLVPLPFTPPRVQSEATAFARAVECPLCAAIDSHRPEGLVVAENASFVWLCPAASSFAMQQWIVPKRHVTEMTALSDEELADLAGILTRAAAAARSYASAYNWGFLNFPGTGAAHFYVDIVPRMTTIAGLELATGTFVEIIDPAAAAARLRD